MKAEKAGDHYYTVTVEQPDVVSFMRSWPCSGLDDEASYSFTFSSHTGDLVDLFAVRSNGKMDSTETDDGPDLLALSEDAMKFGALELALEDVIAIRGIARAEPALAM